MNKICTSIEQSKKLLELGIDVNTADMCWSLVNKNHPPIIGKYFAEYGGMQLPAWSLTALLELMPFHIIENNERYGFRQWKGYNSQGETYCFEYISNISTKLCETYHWNNPLDAAFEMVCWLKENGRI